jgi:hypothetical protein
MVNLVYCRYCFPYILELMPMLLYFRDPMGEKYSGIPVSDILMFYMYRQSLYSHLATDNFSHDPGQCTFPGGCSCIAYFGSDGRRSHSLSELKWHRVTSDCAMTGLRTFEDEAECAGSPGHLPPAPSRASYGHPFEANQRRLVGGRSRILMSASDISVKLANGHFINFMEA